MTQALLSARKNNDIYEKLVHSLMDFIGIQCNLKALNQLFRIFSGAYSLVWYCLLEDNGSQFLDLRDC